MRLDYAREFLGDRQRQSILNAYGGFKAFHLTKATVEGSETAHIIRKEQLFEGNMPVNRFMAFTE